MQRYLRKAQAFESSFVFRKRVELGIRGRIDHLERFQQNPLCLARLLIRDAIVYHEQTTRLEGSVGLAQDGLHLAGRKVVEDITQEHQVELLDPRSARLPRPPPSAF